MITVKESALKTKVLQIIPEICEKCFKILTKSEERRISCIPKKYELNYCDRCTQEYVKEIMSE